MLLRNRGFISEVLFTLSASLINTQSSEMISLIVGLKPIKNPLKQNALIFRDLQLDFSDGTNLFPGHLSFPSLPYRSRQILIMGAEELSCSSSAFMLFEHFQSLLPSCE